MNNLERYIMLERIFVDIEENGDFELSSLLERGLTEVWCRLSEEDVEYINKRDNNLDLDHVKLPRHMSWGSRYQHKPLTEKEELVEMEETAKEIFKTKESALAFFIKTGILNEKGELAEEYKNE